MHKLLHTSSTHIEALAKVACTQRHLCKRLAHAFAEVACMQEHLQVACMQRRLHKWHACRGICTSGVHAQPFRKWHACQTQRMACKQNYAAVLRTHVALSPHGLFICCSRVDGREVKRHEDEHGQPKHEHGLRVHGGLGEEVALHARRAMIIDSQSMSMACMCKEDNKGKAAYCVQQGACQNLDRSVCRAAMTMHTDVSMRALVLGSSGTHEELLSEPLPKACHELTSCQHQGPILIRNNGHGGSNFCSTCDSAMAMPSSAELTEAAMPFTAVSTDKTRSKSCAS